MKRASGYTVMELLVTVSLLVALTGISLISIASPRQLLEKETVLAQVSALVSQVQLEPLVKGQSVKLSFTPWTLWVNDQKRLEFPQNGPWQWKSEIKDLTIQPDNHFSAINQDGEAENLPQAITLTYNQSNVAFLTLNPAQGSIRFTKASESPDDTCQN